MPTRTTSQRGFTLLELMITLTVAMIGMAGLLSMHGTMSRANKVTARQLEATGIAELVLESFRGETADSLIADYGAIPLDEDLGEVEGRNGQIFRRRLIVEQVAAAPTALIRLRVEIGWTDDGAEPGSEGGLYDHVVALEVIRPEQGSL